MAAGAPTPPPAPDAEPEVSVVIAVYNGEETIRECLEAVLRQEGVRLEVVVVDDGSTDGTPGVLAGFGERIVALRNVRNSGISRTFNRGIRESRAPVVLLLASDCILVQSDAVRQALDRMRSAPDIGVVAGRAVMPDFEHLGFAHRLFTVLNRLEVLETGGEASDVNFTELRCDLIRRDVLARSGLLNEVLTRSNEDQDLSVRIRRLGLRLLQDPKVHVVLRFGGTGDTFGKLLKKQTQYARGQAFITVNYGLGSRQGLWTNANRRSRAAHRASQCVVAPAAIALAVASLWAPWARVALAALVLGRMAQHVWYARKFLRPLESLAAGPVGFVSDMLYGSTLITWSVLWTVRGRSALGGAVASSAPAVSSAEP
jgi:GT2 family glycosyltransferase